jgi:predicted RNA-binding Zn ribbon-like protein
MMETLEILGGASCLDFANTINSRRSPEHDYLRSYADLVSWGRKTALFTPAQADRLLSLAEQHAGLAQEALHKALVIREMLYQLFSKIARQLALNPQEMQDFVDLYADAIAHSRFIPGEHHFTIDWKQDEAFDSLLWPVLYSAGQILLSSELRQVKECPNCGWLFMDRSKNQSRRWCSMDTCGARDKMRRYHRKPRPVNP